MVSVLECSRRVSVVSVPESDQTQWKMIKSKWEKTSFAAVFVLICALSVLFGIYFFYAFCRTLLNYMELLCFGLRLSC